MTRRIKPGMVEYTTTFTAEDVPDMFKELLAPVAEWRPPVFDITPGDAEPGTTIRARNITTTPTDTGIDIGFDSRICGFTAGTCRDTGEDRYCAVFDGGYSRKITRDVYLALIASLEQPPQIKTVAVAGDATSADDPRTNLLRLMLQIANEPDGIDMEIEGLRLGIVKNPRRIRTDRETLHRFQADLAPADDLRLTDEATGEPLTPDIAEFWCDEEIPTVSINVGKRAP